MSLVEFPFLERFKKNHNVLVRAFENITQNALDSETVSSKLLHESIIEFFLKNDQIMLDQLFLFQENLHTDICTYTTMQPFIIGHLTQLHDLY